ncbi:ATP-binding cassette domain-containing protein [Nitrosopumilus piranensis]|uniref:O-antigen export system ATP-binding protein RfbB (Modular protein) n=1 Tax=Nitrosopumilus piranensis TaxID=1582439 RepID=A0A0C5BNH4_9ARCH|nr:ATP-binding cassette domain-containing protein [Nitrosopumilus piranensis]AJM91253.1 O-antigen export system ATP-binding protein RfbB (modular protein) [Nitrosopumilus piranensis]
MIENKNNIIKSKEKIFQFNSNLDIKELDNSKEFNFEENEKFSISLWVKFYGKQYGSALSKMNDDKSDMFKGWDVRFHVENEEQKIIFYMNNNYPSNCLIHQTGPINEIGDYKWHHLVFAFNGLTEAGSLEIFIDGVKTEVYCTGNSLKENFSNMHPITMGGRFKDKNHFNGKICKIRIIKNKLSIDEILKISKEVPLEENNKKIEIIKDEIVLKASNITRNFRIHQENDDEVFRKLRSIITKKTGYKDLNVLNDISFELKKGEVLGILGRNGSGKSTLLKILGKIMNPTSGEIEVHGRISSFISIGAGFHPEISAAQNIVLYGVILGLKKHEMEQKIDEVIRFAELEGFENSRIKDFSTGMLMRLALSTALCVDPDILLIDEVLSVGDYSFQEKSNKAFQLIKKSGKSIIFVSHNLRQLEEFCDRVILLENGKIIDSGKPEKVIESYVKLMKK